MHILLINPHYPMPIASVLLHPPLGFAYMATELKRRGHGVTVLDLPMRDNCIESEASFLLDCAPDLIGVTCVTQSYAQALEVVAFCKQVLPDVPTAVGGPHVTFTPQETLDRHPAVDFVLLHDCEYSLADMIDCLRGGRPEELVRVPGIAFRSHETGRPIVTAVAAPVIDLDELPRPDRSIFDMRAYLEHDYETVVMASRGCPSRCAFCSTTRMGRRYRHHGIDAVLDEIETLVDFGFNSVFFGDDTFSGNPSYAIAFCDAVKRRGIEFEWTSNMRVADARVEVLDAMASAGAYRVFTGIETVKKEGLKLIQKGTTPKTIQKAVERVDAAGIELHAAFIIGVPGDTGGDIAETLNFIKAIEPTVATFNTMEVRPGTAMFNDPQRFGLTIPDPYWYEATRWMEMPTCHTNELGLAEIKTWVERCYHTFCSGHGGH